MGGLVYLSRDGSLSSYSVPRPFKTDSIALWGVKTHTIALLSPFLCSAVIWLRASRLIFRPALFSDETIREKPCDAVFFSVLSCLFDTRLWSCSLSIMR